MSTDTNHVTTTKNGKPRTGPEQDTVGPDFDATTLSVYQDYRPTTPSTDRIVAEIGDAMGTIVHRAIYEADDFIRFARNHDKDAPDHIRFNHITDARECLEIALTHMTMWMAALDYTQLHPDQRFSLTDRQF